MRVSLPRSVVMVLFSVCWLESTKGVATAGPIVLETNVAVNTGCVPLVTCADDLWSFTQYGPLPGIQGSQGYGLVEVSGTFNGAFLSSAASADASAGVLKTSATLSYDLASPDYRMISAGAEATDELTITAPGIADGTAGLLGISITVDGTITKSGSADGGALFGMSAHGPNFADVTQLWAKTSSGSETFSMSVPFTFGTPFFFTMFMGTGAGTLTPNLQNESFLIDWYLAPAGPGAANVDFFNTLVLSGLLPTDLQGNPVTNPLFVSGSGARYSVNGVTAVPEPGTLLLLGSGTALLFRRRNKRS